MIRYSAVMFHELKEVFMILVINEESLDQFLVDFKYSFN